MSNNYRLKKMCEIHIHEGGVNFITSFPSGNIISVSNDQSIKIFDNINFKIIQNIQNAHTKELTSVDVKDENTFVTSSSDQSLKLWIQKDNKYINNKTIQDAHDDDINKVIFCSNGNLISCSWDYSVRIWKENNGDYENIKKLKHSDIVGSVLFLEDKNILVSAAEDGTKLWSLDKNDVNCDNITELKFFNETFCEWSHHLCRLNEDIIIVKGSNINQLILISLSKKEIIQEIDNTFECYSLGVIKFIPIFLVGGERNIRVYRKDNFECIQKIDGAHSSVNGFYELKNKYIASFSYDKSIKIWNI